MPEYRTRREALEAERRAARGAVGPEPVVPEPEPVEPEPVEPEPEPVEPVPEQEVVPATEAVKPAGPPEPKVAEPAPAPRRPAPVTPPAIAIRASRSASGKDLRELAPLTAALVEALDAAGVAEFESGRRRRAEYSSDASLYRVVPQAVVFPRHVDELAATLKVCRDLAVPLTVRGAGTSIAGNAVGPGVVADLSRHLSGPVEVDAGARTATVAPGTVLADLQAAAGRHGLRFGPDPSTHNRATLGGMIGNNACGSRALAYGRTSDNLLALDVLTGGGERLRLVSPQWRGSSVPAGADPTTSPALQQLSRLVGQNLAVVRTEFGRFGRQISGYSLEHLLPEKGFDVTRFLAGSEGTLAVVLGATVRLVDVPQHSVLVALGYPDMAAAGDAVPSVLPFKPVAVEGLDARIVEAVRSRRGAAAVPELPPGRGWLFVELAGPDLADLEGRARAVARNCGALESRTITDPVAAAALWRIREAGAGLSGRSPAGRPAHAGWEDSAVPPERLGAYLRDFEQLLQRFELTAMPYGHFGDGCLHARIDLPLDRPDGTRVFRDFLSAAAELVVRHGGSLSGEHGDGRARSELLAMMYSAEAVQLFAGVKAAFDPDDVLNPGVLVAPAALDADLRVPAAARAIPLKRKGGYRYAADGGDLGVAVHRCTGVGACRVTTTGPGAMCPSYQATRDEKDSTRARARVLQEMVNGSLVRGGWRAEEVRDSLDACLACKACSSECPTGIDMAGYKAEVLHQAYRHRIRPRSHYTLGRLPSWAAMASRATGLSNALLGPRLGGMAKAVAGVDPRRSLPAFVTPTLRSWFGAHTPMPGATGELGEVVLLADSFTNHFAPQVGIAAVRVLEAAGFRVRITPKQVCCGLTWITTGQLDQARRRLTRSIDALAGDVAAGVPVVGLEPSCTAVFRSDAAELLGERTKRGSDVTATGRGVVTLAEVLTERAEEFVSVLRGSLAGVSGVAQPHCHHRAVMTWSADAALLLGAGADIAAVGGCCGLAGNWGVEKGHHELSEQVARLALLPAVAAADAAAPEGRPPVVLADGFSCRTQLDQLANRPSRHLAELLADVVDSAPS